MLLQTRRAGQTGCVTLKRALCSSPDEELTEKVVKTLAMRSGEQVTGDALTADRRHDNRGRRHRNKPFILKHAEAAANLHNCRSSAARGASVRTVTGNIWSF